MKKIIKWLLVVLLVFPLYSCKDYQLNEFGITYKLEEELKRAVYDNNNYYKEDGYPIEALELTYYFGEIEGYHAYLCYASFELYSFSNYITYYLYKKGKLYTLQQAVDKNLISDESVSYLNTFLWKEENADERELISKINNYMSTNEILGEAYCKSQNIDIEIDKSPVYKYKFDYIVKYRRDKEFDFRACILKEKNKFTFINKEIVGGIEFYYFNSNRISLLGATFYNDSEGKMQLNYKYLSLQEGYDLGYITKENLKEIKEIAIEKGYIKDK